MNKKLKKYLEDGERLEERIKELQEQLKGIRAAQEIEENREIVKSFRGLKLNGRELFSLLCGLQDGSVTLQKIEKLQEETVRLQPDEGRGSTKPNKEGQDALEEHVTEERMEE